MNLGFPTLICEPQGNISVVDLVICPPLLAVLLATEVVTSI